MISGTYLYDVRQTNRIAREAQVATEKGVLAANASTPFADISEIPKRIMIDKIGVDADIEPVGLLDDGMLDAPKTNELVGWYDKSARAGDDQFAMLLDGHYGTQEAPAVFWRLLELEVGDTIHIQSTKKTILKYEVKETERQYAEDVDMKKALYPYRDGAQSLTIITCEGEFDPLNMTYDRRIVVYAERVE